MIGSLIIIFIIIIIIYFAHAHAVMCSIVCMTTDYTPVKPFVYYMLLLLISSRPIAE